MEKNYYLRKNSKTGEIIYLEYDKIKGYPITPKTKIEDAISVNKIIFVNPSLQEKLIRKKVEVKLRCLIRELEDNDSTSSGTERAIMDAEKLRVNIINRYIHYLGNTYASYSLSKIQVIVNQLKIKLYKLIEKEKYIDREKRVLDNELYYLDIDEPKKGRGR